MFTLEQRRGHVQMTVPISLDQTKYFAIGEGLLNLIIIILLMPTSVHLTLLDNRALIGPNIAVLAMNRPRVTLIPISNELAVLANYLKRSNTHHTVVRFLVEPCLSDCSCTPVRNRAGGIQ